jgi:hypothetical protein
MERKRGVPDATNAGDQGSENAGPNSTSTDRTDRIAQRAYQRFQERGGEHGRDQEDWFEAERELGDRGNGE